jgi:hypothetical protein
MGRNLYYATLYGLYSLKAGDRIKEVNKFQRHNLKEIPIDWYTPFGLFNPATQSL